MRRFNYDDSNEEYRREVDRFFGEIGGEEAILTPEEYEAAMQEEQAIYNLQQKLVQQELNHRLLRTAIRMVDNSFWSKFYSLGTRLQMIDKVFKRLKKLEEQSDAKI